MNKIYIVGDSTLSCFKDPYYYPRYGYGTQIKNYFNDEVEVINLALSGRSSKSFLIEDNYKTLINNITNGDYLIIGFGHNDEKDEDPNRFTTANKDLNDTSSYPYYLNHYYVEIAKNKGATPILCTPICRADINNCYEENSGHITKNGDYRKAVINLGIETNTTVIDLTERTKELYIKIGYDKAILFHAWPKNKKETVDTTHLNIYGAKMVAYLFVEELKKTDCNLKNYLLQDLIKPTIKDLIPNKEYIDLPYVPFNKDKYKPTTNFSHIKLEGWYGTAFGDTGSNPLDLNTGYIIKEENNKFIIGQDGQYLKGKIANTEGIPFLFKQINKDDNFKVNVDVKVIKKKVDDMAGFGLMLRDDVYTDQSIPDNTILSNYVAAGLYNDNEKTNIIYSRENKKLINTNYNSSYFNIDDTAHLELERIGQVVNIKVIYKNKTYTKTYTDFDFLAIDNKYMYVGLYATCGLLCEFDNLEYIYLGKSQGA